jgi:hypothetical protein
MRVRCRGHILRVVKKVVQPIAPVQDSNSQVETSPERTSQERIKIGVAVRLECYEYLSDMAESSPSFARVSALHSQPEPVR